VAESKKFRFTGHIHFKKSFRSRADLSQFVQETVKFLRAEVKKIPGVKVAITERPFSASIKGTRGTMSISFARNHIDILIISQSTSTLANANDGILNRLVSYVDLSQPSVKEVGFIYSEEIHVDKNPIENFLNKAAFVEFNSKTLRRFSPAYLVLDSTEKDLRYGVGLEYDEMDNEASVEITEIRRKLDKFPYAVIQESAKSISEKRPALLSALGVSEKRSPDKKK
jgi:hypothetical protein